MAREKGESRGMVLKFGVALALSIGGILFSFLRTKRINKPSQSQSPPSPRPSGRGNQADLGEGVAGLKTKTPTCRNFDSVGPDKNEGSCRARVITDNSISPSSISNGDKDGFLLPEFDELIKEFDLATIKANISPRKDVEALMPDSEASVSRRCLGRDDKDQEIKRLKNTVKILKERERALEMQLLELYGLKEQETAVLELQNRLKINNVEAKLFNLKIKSLQADNMRLERQVADYAKVVTDLEAARTKIKVLKKKLRSEAEHNREQILALQKRVAKMQDQEHEPLTCDSDTQSTFQKLKDLEEEAKELKKSNCVLQLERSDLSEKLEYIQILATSVLEDEERERLKEEAHDLNKQNEDLMKEIERLQEDRCADAEELVYLRWVNACLRYELRNYQPAPGKTIARDLSKTLSPKSEEKAKQLILEYANKEGVKEKGLSISEIDFDQWFSSPASYLTDSGEFEDSSIDNNSSTNKTNTSSKSKIFGKLMKLMRVKDGHHDSRGASVEDVGGIDSSDSPACISTVSTVFDGHGNRSGTSSLSSSRHSLDLQRLKIAKSIDNNDSKGVQRDTDVATSFMHKRIPENVAESPQVIQLHHDQQNVQKSELMKYAEALQVSRGESQSFRRRSVSFSSL
ncbi:hypothetical protein LguiA_009977 [Lonicera macranthoides]